MFFLNERKENLFSSTFFFFTFFFLFAKRDQVSKFFLLRKKETLNFCHNFLGVFFGFSLFLFFFLFLFFPPVSHGRDKEIMIFTTLLSLFFFLVELSDANPNSNFFHHDERIQQQHPLSFQTPKHLSPIDWKGREEMREKRGELERVGEEKGEREGRGEWRRRSREWGEEKGGEREGLRGEERREQREEKEREERHGQHHYQEEDQQRHRYHFSLQQFKQEHQKREQEQELFQLQQSQQQQQQRKEEKVLYMVLHIPKAAGSTLKQFLQELHAKICKMKGWGFSHSDFASAIKQSNSGSCDFILVEAGYWFVEQVRSLSIRPIEYIVFLRDPVLRTISQLEMFRRFLPHSKRDIPMEELIYLSQVVFQGTGRAHVFSKIDNFQTTFLSCPNGSFTTFQDKGIRPLFKLGGGDVNFLHSRFDPSCLPNITIALSFLEKAFFVGFVEDTEQCICKLLLRISRFQSHTRTQKLCYGKLHLSKKSWHSAETRRLPNYTPNDLKYLDKVNTIDQSLYWKIVEQRGGEPIC